ncbi:ribosomal protein S18 acetylase RimI-like enzyme [Bacillus pakistanensis]|uniref:Ribosomal protein S18 acetylase RimI-like enzyme n=1 Tax=Rossellomorea pakistanensis TaxID=992288 RepID=A0ABS2N762_9BACI|nr:GNAT family N-acetyltransferase [Bacillus pakistanensis]MBM7583698.1 ribosomal protein S18 acetylase RimI-like enzyme [Bacillus pakistanensis]
MKIRTVKDSDYDLISPLINEWWGGRQMSDMLPRLFFTHFQDTSFIAEKNGEITGFLIGFLSQSHRQEGYIHFVGVDPDYRNKNIANNLYHEFSVMMKKKKRTIIRCVTSPINKGSIAFHQKMGFEIIKGDTLVNGVSVHSNYDGENGDRVLFIKKID